MANTKAFMVIRFQLERETKGALRYAELSADGKLLAPNDEGAHIGTLYLRKAKMSLGKITKFGDTVWPTEIYVSVESAFA